MECRYRSIEVVRYDKDVGGRWKDVESVNRTLALREPTSAVVDLSLNHGKLSNAYWLYAASKVGLKSYAFLYRSSAFS